MTVEEDIGYELPGINQIPVRAAVGLTVAGILRELDGQDPNVVCVRDIQEPETATLAYRHSLAGRLVLARMAGDDAATTLADIRDLAGASLAARATSVVVAQRLVRRLCECKEPRTDVLPEALFEIGFRPDTVDGLKLHAPGGCSSCSRTGYRGRVGLEVLEVTIRELVAGGAPVVAIKRKALEDGMLSLRMCGLEKIRAGVTTIEEVIRETAL